MGSLAFASPVALVRRRTLPSQAACRRSSPAQAPRACERPSLPKGFGNPRPQGSDSGKMGFVGGAELGLVFTCNVCETRVAKKVKRKSYETGVCLVQCPGCEKYHVIADNLGYYKDATEAVGGGKNVEDFAKAKGEEVKRVTGDIFDLEKLVSEKGDEAVDIGRGEVAGDDIA